MTQPLVIIQQEIHIQGPEGPADVRVTNSYPSKVRLCPPNYTVNVVIKKGPHPIEFSEQQ
jgi:hypothetical protein